MLVGALERMGGLVHGSETCFAKKERAVRKEDVSRRIDLVQVSAAEEM